MHKKFSREKNFEKTFTYFIQDSNKYFNTTHLYVLYYKIYDSRIKNWQKDEHRIEISK